MNQKITQPLRPGSVDKTQGSSGEFPFFAFEHDNDGKEANPTLTLKSPWNYEVEGDLSTGGNFTLTGKETIADTTESTNKDTGALVLEGGLGVEKNLNVGGDIGVTGGISTSVGIQVPVLHVQDQKPSGTDGGTFTAGAWQTRTLNTVLTNTITGASLSSNQITLPAGTYKIECICPVQGNVKRHQARLYNTTDSVLILSGTSKYLNVGGSDVSTVSGLFTISSVKTFEVQHRCETTYATYGFGVASGAAFTVDHETYSDVFIEKIG